jgi:hypothetical protein
MHATAVGDAKPTKVYLDAPFASVRWEGDGRWVVVEWRTWASSSEFRAVQETALAAVQEKRASRFLVNAQNARLIVSEDERWTRDDLIPRRERAGIRWTAIVAPVNKLAWIIYADLAKTPRSEVFQRAQFATLDEAKAWLSTMGTPESIREG